jgi:hypothetical protein
MQAITAWKIFAVLHLSYSPYSMFQTDKVSPLIFAVFLKAEDLRTLIFTMRPQLGGTAYRTDITNRTYL